MPLNLYSPLGLLAACLIKSCTVLLAMNPALDVDGGLSVANEQ